ncbi:bifunctional adenosylcobinamide kinase/adenosylcobinamide-phosphate guanylyltransferase [Raineyella sp.]|uniref:bifunctional adenosylcobinamide kinase/adenosylcobinamide-phosphate guanylyltransferase n=1 Tax=Raineyella sp. TaxID=1911550 RepID=UPI002B20CB23|nr:bifunctional adenosylcobinamide kinase/adenosylcobinamide-phosphate guanylyltransferase [Raineyella sp.]MEA5155892.1 bifunctional adenosylcobinamide kinase/adenosylcobinamide-phosphate guanylyltransferase [Raineyella sp.]
MPRTVVTGGVRSGKSTYAERLLSGEPAVTYVAPGPVPDPAVDPEWAARVAAHRARRPDGWTTVETADVAAAVRAARTPVLVDCLGTWVTRTIDDLGTWDVPRAEWVGDFLTRLDDLVDAWEHSDQLLVAVTNEVGWGVVPSYPSGRVFADLLGRTNQAIAGVSDRLVLMVAGRPLELG